MNKLSKELIFTINAVLVMMLVSLSIVYSKTYNWFGSAVGSKNQDDYGDGFDLSNRGFWVHLFIFGLIMFLMVHYNLIQPKYTIW